MLRALAVLMAVWLSGCASLPPMQPVAETHALQDPGSTPLGRLAAANVPSARAPSGGELSGFRLLPDAPFALDARLALAARAAKTLDVQYYILQNDMVGRTLLRALRDAADRGVRVRLLVDDAFASGQDELFSALAAHANVEVRLFNPLPVRSGGIAWRYFWSLHEFGRVNHRMHNKLFIVDNCFSVSGGRNIADEYFMRGEDANFIDMDVLAVGPIVREQSAAFDAYWNSPYVRPIAQVAGVQVDPGAARRRFAELTAGLEPPLDQRHVDIMRRPSVLSELEDGRLSLFLATAQVYYDAPDKIARRTSDERYEGSVAQRTLALIEGAKAQVVVVSPYFIPGQRGLGQLRKLMDAGVNVVATTNSLSATDEPLVYFSYARYRYDMLRMGVSLYEIGPELASQSRQFGEFGRSIGRLHTKMAVVDETQLFIGSMNLDGRSARINTEVGLVIDSFRMADDFASLVSADRLTSAYQLRLSPRGAVEWVERDAQGHETVYYDEPKTSWTATIFHRFVETFVDEEQL
jgi:putative cardiolipin synthase